MHQHKRSTGAWNPLICHIKISADMSHVNANNVKWMKMKYGLARRIISNRTKAGALVSQTIMSRGIMLAEEWINPHTSKSPDVHVGPDEEELYYIVEGRGYVVLNGKRVPVRSGSVVYIPPKTEHYVMNTGETPFHYLAAGYNIKVTRYNIIEKRRRIQLVHKDEK